MHKEMNCRRNYPLDCTDNCPLHRSGRCNVRRRNDGGRNNGSRDNDRRNNNGGNSSRHGNAPRRENRGHNQEHRDDDSKYIPMPCEQTWMCMGKRCSLFQSGNGCRRPDLRAQRMPKTSSAETIGGIITTGLGNMIKSGLKNLFGL